MIQLAHNLRTEAIEEYSAAFNGSVRNFSAYKF